MTRAITMLVVAKAPVAGSAKTRLCPPLLPEQAAEVAAAALIDTLDAVEDYLERRRAVAAVIALTGDLSAAAHGAALRHRIAPAPPRVDPLWRVILQRGNGFGERLTNAHIDAAGFGATFQIGMDTPQVTPELLREGVDTLGQSGVDAVIGPAVDGGWWSLGLRQASMARVLRRVPMSRTDTLELTLQALWRAGLRVAMLPTLTDVDTAADAATVAALAPDTRFAQTWRAATSRPVVRS